MARSNPTSSILQKQATPVVLVFHKLLASFSFSATNFSPRQFARLLTTLERSGYAIRPDMTGERVVCTFDDGYQHLAKVLPVLIEQLGIQPVVFMPTALIGKPNSWDYSYWLRPTPHLERREIRELANAGVVFGSHAHHHYDLTRLPSRRLQFDLRQSREVLSDLAAQKIDSISYPFGRVNKAVLEAAEWAGYQAGYTMRWPSEKDHPLAQGRIPVYAYDSLLSIRHKLGEGPLNRLERIKVAVTNRLSGGTVLLNRLRRLD